MPASASPSPSPRRSYAALAAIAVLAALATILFALPASLITHFLPRNVRTEDLSGSLWHGSAGRLLIDARDAGAIEWRLSPASLLTLTAAADLRWVKIGFVLEAAVRVGLGGLQARNVHGGGPLQDLADLGLPGGVQGTAEVAFARIDADATRLSALAGDLRVAGLALAQVGGGADLGSYLLHFGDAAVGAAGTVTGRLSDTGGPLQVQGTVELTPATHVGTLTGTLKERAALPDALRTQIDSLGQVRGRDAQGRIPVDLEFSF